MTNGDSVHVEGRAGSVKDKSNAYEIVKRLNVAVGSVENSKLRVGVGQDIVRRDGAFVQHHVITVKKLHRDVCVVRNEGRLAQPDGEAVGGVGIVAVRGFIVHA